MRDDLIWDVEGWRSSPAAALEAQFNRVAGQQMADLPFYQAHMPIKACGFQLFEGQWVGAMLTPWMLELVVLPGPDQQWPRRQVGSRLALTFPAGDMAFRVGELTPELHYVACSLMSPLDPHLNAEQAITLTENSVSLALSLPVQRDAPVNMSRRALLRGKVA
ncbi:hydrogenase-2 assembly chaperone [Atlantibacter subterranea]|uniref:Hydrogenase-2 assembly chaperone n=1 Tax=Atlantibacter subterraneus TaxID=255519 RepID=A0ABU4E7A3_9ENTR|nr:hydrogenase-2 assembly chaperone [Atlantibacter subterranea]MDV7025012.1 hydrogenase-2 assembly chaperone [Atlantibacter subterranea]MDZ5668256.1 hydrogenase-2 assembly chaperone [Atlantibacter hermannii]